MTFVNVNIANAPIEQFLADYWLSGDKRVDFNRFTYISNRRENLTMTFQVSGQGHIGANWI